MKSIHTPLAALLIAFILAACGGDSASESDAYATDDGAAVEEEAAAVEFTLRPVGEEMKFEQTSVTVAAGQEVTLIMENTATSAAMVHNIVVLNSNSDEVVNRVGIASLTVGEVGGYIPEDEAILAYTPLAKPGETASVTFTAPSEPGIYRYICTYPGHYALMQGELVVT